MRDTMPCPVRERFRLPYLAFHEDAERRAAKGQKQAKCAACERYVWPDQQKACKAFVRGAEDTPDA